MDRLIQFIVDKFFWLWPWVRLNEWSMGMMVRNGRIHRVYRKGGIYFRLWGVDEFFRWPQTEVSLNLEAGTITTQDQQTVAFSGNLSYRLTDIEKFYRSMFSNESTLGRIMLGILCTAAAQTTWTRLSTQRSEFEAEQLDKLQELSDRDEWGVDIVRFNMTDLAKTKVQRHYFDGALPVGR